MYSLYWGDCYDTMPVVVYQYAALTPLQESCSVIYAVTIVTRFLYSQLLPAMLNFLVTALVMLVISAVLAPFESLGWWVGWFGQPRETPQRLPVIEDIDEVDHSRTIPVLSTSITCITCIDKKILRNNWQRFFTPVVGRCCVIPPGIRQRPRGA